MEDDVGVLMVACSGFEFLLVLSVLLVCLCCGGLWESRCVCEVGVGSMRSIMSGRSEGYRGRSYSGQPRKTRFSHP